MIYAKGRGITQKTSKDYILEAIKGKDAPSLKYELGQVQGFYAVKYINELVADGEISWHEVSILMNKASKL